MRIVIGADFVPTETNADLFTVGDIQMLIGTELEEYLRSADYRIFNLETPLIKCPTPIKKCGPNLGASPDCIKAYTAIGADLLTVANNHIFDHGFEGLKTTIGTLEESHIAFVGIGNNETEAKLPFTCKISNKEIAVYACTEHEFSVATENSPGANAYNIFTCFDDIKELKEQSDFVIVLYHGGKEQYRYPSPELQMRCRKFIESGADLVICQHSHCIGCEEQYLEGTIVYGQGNFLFDYKNNEYWNSGLLVEIEDDFSISYVPVVKSKNCVRLANNEEKSSIMSSFVERSNNIKKEHFLEDEYRKLAADMYSKYLSKISGVSDKKWFIVLNKLTNAHFEKWYIQRRYKESDLLMIKNIIECEAHRELLLEGINEKIG